MDKNIIKKHLADKFLKEDSTPGITMASKMKKEETKINNDGVKAIDKDMAAYDKTLKQENPDNNKMATNKFNYVDDAEKTYHDELEIMNGQEMIEYRSEPGSEFTEKAKEAIEGSSRMGNEKGGNAEEAWGSASDKFGKDLTKRIKDSSKKRADAEIQTYGMGDVQIPTGNKVQTARTAVTNFTKPKGDTTTAGQPVQKVSDKQKIKTVKENESITPKQTKESMKRLRFKKEFNGVGNALKLIPESYKIDKKEFEMTDGNENYRIRWEGNLTEGKAVVLLASSKNLVNEDINRMKALFNYKSESTLGLVKGKERLNENEAFADVYAKTKKLLGEEEEIEDVKPEKEAPFEEAGITVAPEAKKDIEGSVPTEKKTNAPEPKKGPWEEAGKKGASSDKGTQAPKPKEGPWEEAKTGTVKEGEKIESVKPKKGPFEEAGIKQAPEAKKHVEGSVPTDKKTNAPAPKAGTEDGLDNAVDQAPEAKKDISTKKATATTKAKTKEIAKDVVTEKVEVVVEKKNPKTEIVKEEDESDLDDDGGEEETSADAFLKADTEDNGPDDDAEPDPNAVKSEPVPPIAGAEDDEAPIPPVPSKAGAAKLMFSPSAQKHYIMVNKRPTECPEKFVALIKTGKMTPETALTKIQDELEFAPVSDDSGEEGVEEGLFSKSPEKIKKIGMDAINMHPVKKKVYNQLLGQDAAKAEKYVMFVGNNPDAKQINWDEKIQNFVDSAISSHGMASGA